MILNFKTFLQSHAPFAQADLEAAMQCFQPRSLRKGEVFVPIGKVCSEAAFIVHGSLKTHYLNAEGEEVVSCFCAEGCMTTAYRSFVQQVPTELGLVAIEDTELLVIGHDDFQSLLAKSPIWKELALRLLEREYLKMEQYASVLNNEGAKEKYLRLLHETPKVLHTATVAEIASYLGVTRRTLSRIRREVANGN